MRFGVGKNIQKDFCVRHVGSGNDYYITNATIQQRLMVGKYLRTQQGKRYSEIGHHDTVTTFILCSDYNHVAQ